MANIAYLHLGSNLGNSKENIDTALLLLHQRVGMIEVVSNIYQTEAWGNTDQADFLNLALKIETNYTAFELLSILKQIELDMGRTPTIKWGPRIIDIDILFFNEEIITSKELTIPHPHIEKRNFVLVPLQEIAANFIHPVIQSDIASLAKKSQDHASFNLMEDE